MSYPVIDIYSIEKSNCDSILKCINDLKITNIISTLKKIEEVEYKMYLYNDIFLMINTKSNEKKCESHKYISNKLIDNILLVNNIINKFPICSVPIISKYNDVFIRHIVSYEYGVHIIKDYSNNNETTTFIRVETDQMDINKTLQLIK